MADLSTSSGPIPQGLRADPQTLITPPAPDVNAGSFDVCNAKKKSSAERADNILLPVMVIAGVVSLLVLFLLKGITLRIVFVPVYAVFIISAYESYQNYLLQKTPCSVAPVATVPIESKIEVAAPPPV